MLRLARAVALLAAASLAACVAGQQTLSPPDRAAVDRVQAWLDGLHGLHARFLQTWPDGAVSEGVALFDPPGRLRLDYAPHDRMVLVASGGHIVVTEATTGSVTREPASASPLGLLLDAHVSLLGDAIRITDVQQTGGHLQLSLVRADNPLSGLLTLVFDDTPSGLQLESLQGVDAERRRTVFRLFDETVGVVAPAGAFDLAG